MNILNELFSDFNIIFSNNIDDVFFQEEEITMIVNTDIEFISECS